ncbi:MAG: ABC transporter permease, partial [Rhodobacteraceae bacterium]|nr:ABC transporter permease [Paracoccaceae bacterium]
MSITSAQAEDGPVLAADGRPLKRSLARALRRQKIRALLLIAPLLLFVLLAFVLPIGNMLFRSVENQIVSETLPRTVAALAEWDANSDEPPGEAIFAELYTDLAIAVEYKSHTRLGSRLNYETTGISSLFRSTGRKVSGFDTDIYGEQLTVIAPELGDPAQFMALMGEPAVRDALPLAADAWDSWAELTVTKNEDDPAVEDVADFVYTALYRDLAGGASAAALAAGFPDIDVSGFETVSIRDQFVDANDKWLNPLIWQTIQTYSSEYTDGYYLNAVDMMNGPDGEAEWRPENQQLYITLFLRTMWMSLAITSACILLGYPVAWLLANLPSRQANLLMILVLLPFWTSLLVRTSAWKVLLQQQGVINDLLVWAHIVADDNRLVMIN